MRPLKWLKMSASTNKFLWNTPRGRMVQDTDMEQEHGEAWGDIRNAVELAQKRGKEATVTTLKTHVSNIDSFTKKWSPKYGLASDKLRS